MDKFSIIFVIFSVSFLFSACENNTQSSQVQMKETPVNNQAINFPILPTKNIETSNLENIDNKK